MNIVNELSPNESQTESCQPHQSSLTCVSSWSPVQPTSIEDLQTWLQGVSPASHSALPENEKAPMTNETCGPPPSTYFASFDPDTHSWKTYQDSLPLDTFIPSLPILPRWGWMHDGALYQQPALAHLTNANGSGLLPTPRANKIGGYSSERFSPTLMQVLISTPSANKQKGAGSNRFRGSKHYRGAKTSEALRTSFSDPIYINPLFAEWLMGVPLQWTDLKPLAMDKFQQWQQQHGIY